MRTLSKLTLLAVITSSLAPPALAQTTMQGRKTGPVPDVPFYTRNASSTTSYGDCLRRSRSVSWQSGESTHHCTFYRR